MSVRNEERDIVALHWFPPQYEKWLRSLRQESRKLVYQHMLNLICLFYSYADSHTVHTGLDEDLLILISRNSHRIQQ